jgi:hypothetical protein
LLARSCASCAKKAAPSENDHHEKLLYGFLCYELISRDFRSLVESNGVVGWKLLQRLVKLLRTTWKEANELENALGTLRDFDDHYPG